MTFAKIGMFTIGGGYAMIPLIEREIVKKRWMSKEDFMEMFALTQSLPGIKSGKDTPTVIIKATDKSSYKNLIDALDEMQICNIGKYVITDIAEADEFLMKNYESKGELSQNIAE